MKKIISILILLLVPITVWAIGWIQTQDVKTHTDCSNASVADSACLIQDLQIWMTSTTPPQTLSSAISTGAVGGGGGGGSLQWIEGVNSATPVVNSIGQRDYHFQQGLNQQLTTVIKVPHLFSSGNAVHIYLSFYSPDSSGTARLMTTTTLVRPGTDAYTSTTNQYPSTNVAITLGAGTVNIPQLVTFDLTDNTGKINGVSVTNDSLLFITLSRDTDTALSDLRVLVYGAEVTFH